MDIANFKYKSLSDMICYPDSTFRAYDFRTKGFGWAGGKIAWETLTWCLEICSDKIIDDIVYPMQPLTVLAYPENPFPTCLMSGGMFGRDIKRFVKEYKRLTGVQSEFEHEKESLAKKRDLIMFDEPLQKTETRDECAIKIKQLEEENKKLREMQTIMQLNLNKLWRKVMM